MSTGVHTHHQIGSLGTEHRIDLGPEHPTRAGVVDLQIEWDDSDAEQASLPARVKSCEIQPGHLHRGAEKLFEVRDYRQVLMLADRHDWQAPFSGELGAALVCEHLWGLSAPPRAIVVRTLMAEVARIGSHLAFLSWVPFRLKDAGVALAIRLRTSRDDLRQLTWALSGNRLHPMLNRLGGLAHDASPSWLDQSADWAGSAAELANELDQALLSPAFDGDRGWGELSLDQVHAYGVSGPAARASGLEIDLRRQPGYLSYSQLDCGPSTPPGATADAIGRLRQLCHEVAQSAQLVRQCTELADRTPGPVNVKLAKIIKLPDAEARITIEAPWGMAGFHLVSRGDRTPWRLALRTPTFANTQALQQALIGTPADRLDVVIASLAWTTGDLDK